MATTAELRDRLNTGLELLGLDLDSRQCEQLLTYVALLDKWNKVYNLTAVRDPVQMVSRHILDSLTTLQYIAGNSMIDIGTGAGLPGIPVAIACPQLSCTLLDSNGKKTRFVQQTLTELGLSNANVVQCRVEDSELAMFDNIITRAFSSPVDIIAKCKHLCSADGLMIFMMAAVDQQFGDLPNGFALERLIPLEVPFEDGVRHIAIVRKQAIR